VIFANDAQLSGDLPLTDSKLTLYKNSNNGHTTARLTLENSELYDNGNISWKVQNTAITDSGANFILDAANPVFIAGKIYFVTVEVFLDGAPYSKTISLTIAL